MPYRCMRCARQNRTARTFSGVFGIQLCSRRLNSTDQGVDQADESSGGAIRSMRANQAVGAISLQDLLLAVRRLLARSVMPPDLPVSRLLPAVATRKAGPFFMTGVLQHLAKSVATSAIRMASTGFRCLDGCRRVSKRPFVMIQNCLLLRRQVQIRESPRRFAGAHTCDA